MAKSNSKSSKKEVKTAKAPQKAAVAKKTTKPVIKKAPEKKVDKAPAKGIAAKSPVKPVSKPSLKPTTKVSVKPHSPAHAPTTPHKSAGGAKSKVHEKESADKKGTVKKSDVIEAKSQVKSSEKKDLKTPPAVKSAPGKPTVANTPDVDHSKKAKAEKVDVSNSSTPAGIKGIKPSATKKKPAGKKEEFELESDLVGEGDDFSSDELSEYQAELEHAEEEILEEKEIVVEEVSVVMTTTISNEKSDDIVLTDADGRRYCRVKDCDQVSTVEGYCRFHYLLLWKKIQVRKKILCDGKLERYVEELTSRYPDKFLEVIRRDLRTEKDFVSAIQEMEIDESNTDNEFDDEPSNFIDEVRGAAPEGISDDDEY